MQKRLAIGQGVELLGLKSEGVGNSTNPPLLPVALLFIFESFVAFKSILE